MASLPALMIPISADDAAMRRALGQAEQRVDAFAARVDGSLRRAEGSFGRVATTVGHLGSTLTGLATLETARRVIEAADAWTLAGSRIALYTGSADSAADVQERLFGVAQRSRSALEPTVNLYTALAGSMLAMGKSQDDVLRVAETVGKTFKISGTEAGAEAGAIIQLSQALASGVLRGDEFNSVMESSPRLAKALAEGLGVPVGALRGLAEQGQLTADKVVGALLKQGGAVDAEFGRIARTVSDSWTELGNATQREIGRLNQGVGATRLLSAGLSELADHMGVVAEGAVDIGLGLGAVYASRTAVAGTAGVIKTLTTVIDDAKVAAYAQAAATLEAANAEKAAAAQELIRTQQTRARAAATITAAEADLNAARAAAAEAAAAVAAAETDVTRAAAKSAFTRTVYEDAKAMAASRDVTATLTMATEASAAADVEKAAALARLRTAQEAEAAAGAAVALANTRLTNAAGGAAAAAEALAGKNIALGAAWNVAKAAGDGLLSLVGGPWGAALLAGAGAVAFMATRTTAAEQAAKAFADAQRSAQDATKDLAGDVDKLASQYDRMSDAAKAAAEVKLKEALEKNRAAAAAELRAASAAIYSPTSSPFRVVESGNGAAGVPDILAYERMGLAAEQVDKLRAAWDAFSYSAKKGPDEVEALRQTLVQIGTAAGGAGKPLLDLAEELATPGAKIEELSDRAKELIARLTLVRDPSNAAALAVLKAGEVATSAASRFDRLNMSVGNVATKLADLTAKAQMLSLPVGYERRLADVIGAPPETPTGINVPGIADRKFDQDYQQYSARRDVADTTLRRVIPAETKDQTAAIKRQALANRTLSAAVSDAAKAEAQNRVELAKTALEYPGLGDATYRTLLTTRDFGAALKDLPTALQDRWAQLQAASQAQLAGALTQGTVQLTLQAQAQDRLAAAAGQGEAAQRRATIENQVAAASLHGLAGATRSWLDAQEAATSRQIHAEFTGQIDQEVAANNRLVTAMGQGATAVRAATIYNAAVAQAMKEVPPQYDAAGNAVGAFSVAIYANIKKLTEQQDAADRVSFGKYGQQLADQTRQLELRRALIGQSPGRQAELQVEYQIDQLLRSQNLTYESLSETDKRRVDALREQALKNAEIEQSVKRQENAYSTLTDGLEHAADRIGDSLVNGLVNGQHEALKLNNILKAGAASLASDLSKLVLNLGTNAMGLTNKATILDLPFFGGSGAASTQGGSGTLGGVGQANSLSNLMSGSQSLYNTGSWLATSQLGQSLGLSSTMGAANVAEAGVMGVQGGMQAGTVSMSGLGSSFAQGLSYSPWGAVGSIGASMMGLGKGADPYAKMGLSALGSIGGGMAGSAAGAAMGGTMMGMEMGSVLGPIGAVVGAVIGTALSSLIKADKQIPWGQYASYQGQQRSVEGLDGYDTAPLQQAGDTAVTALQSLAASLGVTAKSLPLGGFGYSQEGRGNLSAGWYSFVGAGGFQSSSAQGAGSGDEAVTQFLVRSLRSADLSQVGDAVKTALANTTAKSVQDLFADITVAKNIDDATSGLTDLDTSLAGITASAKKSAAAQYDQVKSDHDRAKALGLGAQYEAVLTKQLRSAYSDTTNAATGIGALSQGLAALDGQFAALSDAVHAMGMSLSDAELAAMKAAQAEKLLKSYRDQWDSAYRSATGLDVVDQAVAVRARWNANWADDLAAGKNPNDLYRVQMQALFSGISDLSVLDQAAAALDNLDSVAAQFARAQADLVRNGLASDYDDRIKAAMVDLGQLSQDDYDRYELQRKHALELKDVTDEAQRADLLRAQAMEDAALAAKQAAAEEAKLTAARDKVTSAAGDVVSDLDKTRASGATGLTKEERVAAVDSMLQRDFALARSTDPDVAAAALQRLSATRQTAEDTYNTIYGAGSAETTAMLQSYERQVSGLGPVKDWQQRLLEELAALPSDISAHLDLTGRIMEVYEPAVLQKIDPAVRQIIEKLVTLAQQGFDFTALPTDNQRAIYEVLTRMKGDQPVTVLDFTAVPATARRDIVEALIREQGQQAVDRFTFAALPADARRDLSETLSQYQGSLLVDALTFANLPDDDARQLSEILLRYDSDTKVANLRYSDLPADAQRQISEILTRNQGGLIVPALAFSALAPDANRMVTETLDRYEGGLTVDEFAFTQLPADDQRLLTELLSRYQGVVKVDQLAFTNLPADEQRAVAELLTRSLNGDPVANWSPIALPADASRTVTETVTRDVSETVTSTAMRDLTEGYAAVQLQATSIVINKLDAVGRLIFDAGVNTVRAITGNWTWGSGVQLPAAPQVLTTGMANYLATYADVADWWAADPTRNPWQHYAASGAAEGRVWNAGYVDGGIVANGVRGVDSVLARFADGSYVPLAGGEFVTPEMSVNDNTLPVLEYIREHGEPPPGMTGYADGGVVTGPWIGAVAAAPSLPRPRLPRVHVGAEDADTALLAAVGELTQAVTDLHRDLLADGKRARAMTGSIGTESVRALDRIERATKSVARAAGRVQR